MEFLAMLATITGLVMSFGYYPQAIKILKRKSAKDVSLITYLIFTPGVIIWAIYGISMKNLPLILSNSMNLVGCLFVLIAYSIYKE